MTFTLRPTAAICALGLAQGVFAQTTPTVQLDPVVVTATRVAIPLADSIASVNLITREDIEVKQPASLADLLQKEAGIEMGRTGGPGSVTSYFLRGANSTNLVILVDGVRAPTDAWGNLTAVDIAPEEIERIEILRGNASAYYGEGAIGGVIAITTRTTQEGQSTHASLGVGSRGAREATLSLTRRIADFKIGLTAGRKQSAALSAMNTEIKTLANPDADAYTQTFARLSLAQELNRDWSWGLQVSNAQNDVDYDDHQAAVPAWGIAGTTPQDIHTLHRTQQGVDAHIKHQVNADWRTQLQVGKHELRQHDRVNGEPATYNADVVSDQDSLQWSNQLSNDLGLINFGLDMAWSSFDNDGSVSTRAQRGAYAGLSSYVGPVSIQANLRRDGIQAKRGGDHASWYATSRMLGLGLDLNEQWRLTAAHTTGFRAPSIGELSANDQLVPERHETLEAGVSYQAGQLRARAVAFQNRTTNALIWVGRSPENVGKTTNKGLELSASQHWGATQVSANWVHQDPRDAGTQTLLLRRAKDYGSLDVNRQLQAVKLGAQLHVSGKRNDTGGTVLAGYTTLDLTASKALTPEWTLRGKIENLTDERYELASGYNTPRRGLFVNLVYQAK